MSMSLLFIFDDSQYMHVLSTYLLFESVYLSYLLSEQAIISNGFTVEGLQLNVRLN